MIAENKKKSPNPMNTLRPGNYCSENIIPVSHSIVLLLCEANQYLSVIIAVFILISGSFCS